MNFLSSYNARTSEGPWHDSLMFVFILLLIPLLPFFWIAYELRRQYRLRSRGFWVARKGRDDIEYQERRAGGIERLTIPGELTAYGPHIVYVPNEDEWKRDMPEWAKTRRDVILKNVRLGLGTKNYEYVLS